MPPQTVRCKDHSFVQMHEFLVNIGSTSNGCTLPSTLHWDARLAHYSRGWREWLTLGRCPRRHGCRSQKPRPSPPHMPPAALTPATPTAVYVAAVPLRAPKGPAQLLMSAGYSLSLWDLQHFMVLLRPDPARSLALVFDFQPRDPEDVGVALAVLSRSEIPGVVRRRTLRRIPDRRCWLVGHCCDGDAVGAADRFSERWPTALVVGEHDCRDYTNGLVEVLTGEKRVLERLRSGGSTSISGAAPP